MSDPQLARTILTTAAPTPAGHYSQAIAAGGLLYVSGQLPIDADGAKLADASFDDQARQAITNVLAVVKGAGAVPANLVKITVYIVGVDHWSRFNAVYATMLGDIRPARTVVPVPELHHGLLVEIDAIALLP
ncbi:RidA family protein [Sphingomonas glacialis]|uniref:RidA family protein n=1 Tax=Sphingomonas glacialis TaxID=658225 RepID=A0A502FSS6_9SPHN|nr:RidA family protein [Sphingomonas glacialis]TPG52053.1 RidA family protein [Sphingomonas glacialis]